MEQLKVINGSKLMNNEREAWGKVLANSDEEENSKVPIPGTQALWKGLTILKLISESPKELRFSDLMDVSGLPKGTLHRILQALVEFRLLRYDQNEQTYKLGTRLFEMAHKVWSGFDLRGAADPELQRLQRLSVETSRLGIIDDGGVLIIDQKESPNPLRLELGVGKKVQLHASAMGKAILAHLPPTELAETLSTLELTRFSANTITNFSEFTRHLDLVKARGYAISVEEQFLGVSSVSAPILDYYGKPIGAVSIVGGSYSLSIERLHSLGREVIESARRIAGNVGESYMSIANKRRPSITGSNRWDCVVSCDAFLGEGPHWNEEKQHLEWVDILEPSVHVSLPEIGQDSSFHVPEIIGAIVPRRRGGHVAVTQLGYRAVDLAKGEMSTLATPDDMDGCRFNDGKCDPKGRFWAGTLALDAAPNKGGLYCLEPSGKLRKVLSNLHISNGLGWNADASKMYLADSGKREIYQFDYDLAAGSLSNKKLFAKLSEEDGSPDGMAIDAEGGVWCAIWDGWKVIRFDADGIIDRVIDLPVPRPTSCAFGGKDLKTLYVTSARIRLSAEMLAEAPLSGSVFALDVGVSGVPVSTFAG
ncbi:SMP-30/gluconolactonase/LRE family protein [Aestuariibacter sp. A3R04]|uniref:SMP-30/gluconolactonase/LRE family protein n=1 Tax=Aestuariibacter sp. A3R04 TaxID=2841571 RepID=UPI001C08E191|nr:SMP-30/gluconolactonase/LRE family protein [Aestuariibacter sp. A3R04]MBU3021344.1 SMP-30/gluconolactonase/LRE family protein [Aestuariibacter sp. A3R04]